MNWLTAIKATSLKRKAFAVSMNQPQQTLIKAIFENVPVYWTVYFTISPPGICRWHTDFLLHHSPARYRVCMERKVETAEFPCWQNARSQISEWLSYFMGWLFCTGCFVWIAEQWHHSESGQQSFEINTEGASRKFDYGTIPAPAGDAIKEWWWYMAKGAGCNN